MQDPGVAIATVALSFLALLISVSLIGPLVADWWRRPSRNDLFDSIDRRSPPGDPASPEWPVRQPLGSRFLPAGLVAWVLLIVPMVLVGGPITVAPWLVGVMWLGILNAMRIW